LYLHAARGSDLISPFCGYVSFPIGRYLALIGWLSTRPLTCRCVAQATAPSREQPYERRPHSPAEMGPNYERPALCERIKHLVTCRSQDDMHLLLFVPEPGLAHLPMQFAALSSQCGASVTASAGELESAPIPMSVIAKKRCRAMVEPPEKGERATLHPNHSTRLNLIVSDQPRSRTLPVARNAYAASDVDHEMSRPIEVYDE
jgi:hypothetical protein